MASPQQPKPTEKPAATFHTKLRKTEVKVSVLNIRGPFSFEIIRPSLQTNRCDPVGTPQGPVPCMGRNRASSKKPHTATTTMLQRGSCHNKDNVCRIRSSTHRLNHSTGLCPKCLAGVSDSAIKECLIIRPIHSRIQNTRQPSSSMI